MNGISRLKKKNTEYFVFEEAVENRKGSEMSLWVLSLSIVSSVKPEQGLEKNVSIWSRVRGKGISGSRNFLAMKLPLECFMELLV